MKKHLLVFVLLIACSVSAAGQGRKALEEKYGFRELRFESDTTAAPDLKLIVRDGKEAYYSRPSDKMNIGEARLQEISYKYYKGLLASVIVKTLPGDGAALKAALIAQYGNPWSVADYGRYCSWGSKNVSLSYRESSSGQGEMYVYSKPMQQARVQSQQEAGTKAKGDL